MKIVECSKRCEELCRGREWSRASVRRQLATGQVTGRRPAGTRIQTNKHTASGRNRHGKKRKGAQWRIYILTFGSLARLERALTIRSETKKDQMHKEPAQHGVNESAPAVVKRVKLSQRRRVMETVLARRGRDDCDWWW